jgi:hypothetical protein
MKEKDYSNYTFYWRKEDELSVDEFIRLEQVALLENEIMKHKIFTVYRPEGMPPSFISLN